MKPYTLSLSRWHKVGERLSRVYLELSRSSRAVFTNTQVGCYLGEAQVARVKADAERGLVDLTRAFEIQDAVCVIRQAIGEANARVGVAPLLAQHDALSRRHKLLESLLAAQGSELVSLEELPNLPAQIVAEDRFDRSRGQVRVRTMEPAVQALLKGQAGAVLVQVYALADSISDLNRERVTVSLPQDVAAAGGL